MNRRLFGKLAATAIGAGALVFTWPGLAYARSAPVIPGTVDGARPPADAAAGRCTSRQLR